TSARRVRRPQLVPDEASPPAVVGHPPSPLFCEASVACRPSPLAGGRGKPAACAATDPSAPAYFTADTRIDQLLLLHESRCFRPHSVSRADCPCPRAKASAPCRRRAATFFDTCFRCKLEVVVSEPEAAELSALSLPAS